MMRFSNEHHIRAVSINKIYLQGPVLEYLHILNKCVEKEKG